MAESDLNAMERICNELLLAEAGIGPKREIHNKQTHETDFQSILERFLLNAGHARLRINPYMLQTLFRYSILDHLSFDLGNFVSEPSPCHIS